MADSHTVQLLHIHPAVGYHQDLVSPAFQLLGQFYDMGLGPTNVQAVGGH